MSLSLYQQAILQEMGIPVWIPKEVYDQKASEVGSKSDALVRSTVTDQSAPKHQSTPITQEQKQSRLAQLRAQMGKSTQNDIPQPEEKSVATQQLSGIASIESPTAPKGIAPSPPGRPLSAEQQSSATAWLTDLQLACVMLGLPSHLASNVMVGTALKIESQAIVLPAEPLSLTSAQKRELWQALGETATTR